MTMEKRIILGSNGKGLIWAIHWSVPAMAESEASTVKVNQRVGMPAVNCSKIENDAFSKKKKGLFFF